MDIQNHLLTGIAKNPMSPNHGGAISPTVIVLHYTASGGKDGLDDASYLSRATSKASAHIVVGRDGTISQIVPFNIKAWHAGVSTLNGKDNVNDFSIGIEIDNWGFLTGDGKAHSGTVVPSSDRHSGTRSGHDSWETYKPAQLKSVEEVIAAICKHYPIKQIVGHEDIAPGRKSDPGPALDKFKKQMKEKYMDETTTDPATKTTTDAVRLRAGPGMNAVVLTVIPKGRKVTVLDKTNKEWTHVSVGEREGYISTEYLD